MSSGTSDSNSSGSTIEIKIVMPDSQTYTLQVDKHVSLPALREQIATVTGVLPENQRLGLNRPTYVVEIDAMDDKLLSAYDVEDGDTLTLTLLDHPETAWSRLYRCIRAPHILSGELNRSRRFRAMNGRSSDNVRASMAEIIGIKIKTLDSQTYTLRVDKHVRVTALKEHVAFVTGVLSEQQRLISRGEVLKDDQLLSAYHVEDGHTLHLVMRQPIPPSSSVFESADSGDSNNSQTAGARVRGGVQEDSDGSSRLPAVRGLAEIYRFIKQTLDEQAGVIGQLMGLLQAHLNLTDRSAWRNVESNAMELCDLLKNYAISLLETSRKIVILPIDRLPPWVSPNRGNSSRGRPGRHNHED